MLGIVLAGFSVVFYSLASTHLYREADQRLASAVNTLIAAVEVRAHVVEWEPAERSLRFGSAALGGPVIWLLTDEQGQLVDRVEAPPGRDFLMRAATTFGIDDHLAAWTADDGTHWQIAHQWIRPSAEPSDLVQGIRRNQFKKQTKFPALAFTAAVPLDPIQGTLRLTALTLGGLSLGIWLMAVVMARIVCRRALRPVAQMALSARRMGPENLTRRLPSVATGDELEDLSRAFNSLLDRLEESFQRQERFTSDASHQLRTPLTAILGQIEVALRRERPSDEYVRVLNTVKHKAHHLQRISESLLFLARSNAEARSPELELIDMGDWLDCLKQRWSESERAGDIVWDCAIEGAVATKTQPVLLGELVNILLDNACKFSRAGTAIRIFASCDDRSVVLTVEDHGCGIAASDIPHLWEPFFRSVRSRQAGVEGIGLGLSIAQRLAECLGAALSVRSAVGSGSAFTLTLPRARKDVEQQNGKELPAVASKEHSIFSWHNNNRSAGEATPVE
jgi:signal transduction histidine kinase